MHFSFLAKDMLEMVLTLTLRWLGVIKCLKPG